MLPSLILLALQPTPPAIVPVPPVVAVPPLIRTVPRPTATFSVRVTMGNDLLVSEQLRVGQFAATLARSRQQALAGTCPGGQASNENLNLSLRPDPGAASANRFRLDLRLSRPVQEGCDAGSRGVTLDQQFDLAPGQSASFTGDGGLRVQLRRD